MLANLISEIKSGQTANYKVFFMDGLLQNENKFRIDPDDERQSAFPTTCKPDRGKVKKVRKSARTSL